MRSRTTTSPYPGTLKRLPMGTIGPAAAVPGVGGAPLEVLLRRQYAVTVISRGRMAGFGVREGGTAVGVLGTRVGGTRVAVGGTRVGTMGTLVGATGAFVGRTTAVGEAGTSNAGSGATSGTRPSPLASTDVGNEVGVTQVTAVSWPDASDWPATWVADCWGGGGGAGIARPVRTCHPTTTPAIIAAIRGHRRRAGDGLTRATPPGGTVAQ